ncbi:hypothetical protein TRP8649_00556 [Pelagimonas phthalicica]|uniref:Uncharacterized protein n=1 Tax=Pelagimonas phthalicica TaxID=1037362 RepID=A0A238J8H4_9RHOB|nr:hypothetical protein [Pelagimonas phthalicica]TDS94997.1 hypothetical protein CLV87_1516 [Pelagimonas phthalicica]SMX26477.1 hypothetical protein TRP8649_00556 [Pelagimonas phthalicica]
MPSKPMTPYDYFADQIPSSQRRAIRQFWTHFVSKADELDACFKGQGAPGRVSEIMEPIQTIHPDLMWEFGPGEAGHELAITSEWDAAQNVLARAVQHLAPTLPGWSFLDARPQAADISLIPDHYAARFGEQLSLSEIQCEVTRTGRIGLTVTGYGDKNQLVGQAEALTAMMFGEWAERFYLGWIEAETQKKPIFGFGKKPALDLQDFHSAWHSTMHEARDQAPGKPAFKIDQDHDRISSLDLEALPDDHPRADLETITTFDRRFSETVLDAGPFSSPALSRFGEWFCTLRLDGEDEPHEDWQAACMDLAIDMHDSLSEAEAGGRVMSGFGARYCYFDFALGDIASGIEILNRHLVQAGMMNIARLRFLDAGLEKLDVPLNPLSTQRPN